MHSILRLGALALFALTAQVAPAAAQNVLLVVADDLGADKLGLYEPDNPTPPTPTLDALAAEGVLFRNAWAMPTCSPTRATIMTGRYPQRHGVGFAVPFGDALGVEEITIPEIYDRAADLGQPPVATLAVGKWHLADLIGGQLDPFFRGFDAYDGNNLGALVPPFSYERWPRTSGTSADNASTTLATEYATTAQVDAARDWIARQSEPWFCYLAFHAPHTPFHAPPAELHSFDLDGLDPIQDPVPFFNAMVEALDTEIGRLLDSIDPAVLAETTVVVVGDNGTTPAVVEAPYDPLRSKGSLYRNGIRVPLIASGAQIVAPGREVSALVDVSDLFATTLELSGIDWPATLPDDRVIDSVSLVPYLTQPFTAPRRDWIAASAIFPLTPPASTGPSVGLDLISGDTDSIDSLVAGAVPASGTTVRNAGFKLIRNDNGSEELFNLTLDPFENANLLQLPILPPPAAAAYAELSAVIDGLEVE